MDYLNCILVFVKENPQVSAALIGTAVALWGILSQRQISRQKNSLDFESAYKRNSDIQTANAAVIDFIIELQKLSKEDADRLVTEKLITEETRDKELTGHVITILNEWERAANAIFSNVYDDAYLYRAHGTSILKLYTYLHCYTQHRQSIVPRYYINFTRLALKWSVERCEADERSKQERKLNSALANVKEAGIKFKDHTISESHDGALVKIRRAQIDIWAVTHRPFILFLWWKIIWWKFASIFK